LRVRDPGSARSASRGSLAVPFDKSTVKDAPKIDPDGQLSESEEAELYRHYGMEYSEIESSSGLPGRRSELGG
jgi:hypothetical protein